MEGKTFRGGEGKWKPLELTNT